MTTYRLWIGYNACENDYQEQFRELAREAESLRSRSDEIEGEVCLIEPQMAPAKYAVRRAMVRLIMRAMHAKGIEVCVSVG